MPDQLHVTLRADPEFHAMLAEAMVRQLVAVAAMRAHNEIRHNFSRARLRLGVDPAPASKVDVLHAQCFRQARRLNVIGPKTAESLLQLVQLQQEAGHAHA